MRYCTGWCRFCRKPRADFLVWDEETEFQIDGWYCLDISACVKREWARS